MEEKNATDKSIGQLQAELDKYIHQFKQGYFKPETQMLNLMEEVGELSREINHYYGEKKKKTGKKTQYLEEELGDVFITLLIMANSLELDLAAIYEKNMEKFRKRDSNRFERVD
ncbi:MazG nucleotide pyrophosphohydrolase domain-containing protein [Vagococcus sp.]|uniref:MazG nucleotide pyrophosphohydrolase domain-containing protein n=1 Tax=Vagococcus sp. TaxID=1933889 RepID=UPI003F95DECA